MGYGLAFALQELLYRAGKAGIRDPVQRMRFHLLYHKHLLKFQQLIVRLEYKYNQLE